MIRAGPCNPKIAILASLLIAGLLLIGAVGIVETTGTPGSAGDTTADVVLGQANFSSNSPHFPNAGQLWQPAAAAVDTSVVPNRLYVADSLNNRVLGFKDLSSFVNGAPADLVIGQPDFVSGAPDQGAANPTAATLNTPYGVAVDSQGNLYVADSSNNRVLEYDSPFATDTVADMVFGQHGSFTSSALNNGGISADSLAFPYAVALDSQNNLYVADMFNSRVLEYGTPRASGDTTADMVFGQVDAFNLGSCDGTGISAMSLCRPRGLVLDPSGNLFVTDTENNRVLEYHTPLSTDTTADRVFGQLGSFTSNAQNKGGVSADSLSFPWGVALDSAGDMYIADKGNNRMLEYNQPLATGSTTASRVFGQLGSFSSNMTNNGGVSADSMFSPIGPALDSSGALYAPDALNNRLLVYRTPLSSSTADAVLGQPGFTYNQLLNASTLNSPAGIAVDRSVTPNRIYVVDKDNDRVLGWKSVGALVNAAPADVVIGQPDFRSLERGVVSADRLSAPSGAAVDSNGNLYVADAGNNRVLEYDSPFTTDAVADMVLGQSGNFTTNAANQGGLSANSLNTPTGVAVDSGGDLFVADTFNCRVLGYSNPASTRGTTANVVVGQPDFASNNCSQSTSAQTLSYPYGVGFDRNGMLYVGDSLSSRVLVYSAPIVTQEAASLVFGTDGSMNTGGCNQLSATTVCQPSAIAVADSGTVYILDTVFSRGLSYYGPTVDTASVTFGQNNLSCNATTPYNLCLPRLVLTGKLGFSALAFAPTLALDSAGDLFIADTLNNRVLEFYVPPAPTIGPVSISPTSLAFGDVAVHTGVIKSVTLTDNQSLPVSANFSLSGGADFFLNDTGCSAPVHGSCDASITFAPTSLGPKSAQLSLAWNPPGASATVAVSGNGVSPTPTPTPTRSATPTASATRTSTATATGTATLTGTPTPTRTAIPTVTVTPTVTPTPVAAKLTISPGRLLFGNAMLGNQGQASRPRSALVRNLSRTTGVVIEGISASGDFAISAGAVDAVAHGAAVSPCGHSLPPRGKCAVTLFFKPTAVGARTGTLLVQSNSESGPRRAALLGKGVSAPIVVQPRSLNFGRVAVGAKGSGTVTLMNRSPVDLTVSGVSSSSLHFTPSQSCVGVLAHGDGICQIPITFKPLAAGRQSATLTIKDNAAKNPHTVRLVGVGK